MRAVPIPDGIAERMAGRRLVIGESDPTRDDVRPCEYVVTPSKLYPGRPCVHALVELEPGDLEGLAATGQLWLTLDGSEVPWSITVVNPVGELEPVDRHLFVDPISRQAMTLVLGDCCLCGHLLEAHDRDTPTGPICGACKCAGYRPLPASVEHPAMGSSSTCPTRAPVSPTHDSFYCTGCKRSGRISGAWVVDLLRSFRSPEGGSG